MTVLFLACDLAMLRISIQTGLFRPLVLVR